MIRPTDPVKEVRWLRCKNVSGVIVPAYGLVVVQGVLSSPGLKGVLQVGQIALDGELGYLVNSPKPIAVNGFGLCTWERPIYAVYQPSDGTPAALEFWGTKASDFNLRKGYPGARILGDAALVGTNNLVLILQPPPPECQFFKPSGPPSGGLYTGSIVTFDGATEVVIYGGQTAVQA